MFLLTPIKSKTWSDTKWNFDKREKQISLIILLSLDATVYFLFNILCVLKSREMSDSTEKGHEGGGMSHPKNLNRDLLQVELKPDALRELFLIQCL